MRLIFLLFHTIHLKIFHYPHKVLPNVSKENKSVIVAATAVAFVVDDRRRLLSNWHETSKNPLLVPIKEHSRPRVAGTCRWRLVASAKVAVVQEVTVKVAIAGETLHFWNYLHVRLAQVGRKVAGLSATPTNDSSDVVFNWEIISRQANWLDVSCEGDVCR